MKSLYKSFSFVLLLLFIPYVGKAQIYYYYDEETGKTPKIKQKESLRDSQTETVILKDSCIDTSDFNTFMLYYSASFEYANKGHYGYDGHLFGVFGRYVGITYGLFYDMGINDPSCFGFHVGPNFCYPFTENFYVYTPLFGNFSWRDKTFGWSVDVVPSVGLKMKRITLSVGVDLGWTKGADKIGTAFYAGIGFSL